jgi:replication fork clamp-binding protein CrfC
MAGTNEDQQKLVDELVKNDDQRTTDEKIEEVLEMMVDTGIKAQLVNQKGIVKENQETLIQTAKNQKPVNSNQVKPDQAAIAGALKVAYGKVIGMNDGVISPDGGLMVSGEKGSIQLDKDDSIVTGTNLGGSSGKSDNGLLSAIQLLVAATQEQTNHLKQLKSDPLFTSNLNAGKYS